MINQQLYEMIDKNLDETASNIKSVLCPDGLVQLGAKTPANRVIFQFHTLYIYRNETWSVKCRYVKLTIMDIKNVSVYPTVT